MEKFVFVNLVRLFTLSFIFLSSSAIAGQWKPLCIEGSLCNMPYDRYFNTFPNAAGPLVTNEGILLHHTPLEFPILDLSKPPVRHIFQLSPSGLDDFGDGLLFVSDANAIQSPTGKIFSFFLGSAFSWSAPDGDIELIDWGGRDWIGYLHTWLTGPPVIVNNVIYIGIGSGGGSQSTYMSTDDGDNWTEHVSEIHINGNRHNFGCCRYNFLENPEKNALWAIRSELFEIPGSLWESTDHGSTWQQVDDGSFPPWTVRVIHDPENSLVSYALTNTGLFVSVDRGISWQAAALVEPIHGMVFVERIEPLSRALIAGTDTGIKISVDEAATWVNMSKGLLAIPHTVTYGHGMLIATSDAGYFTCNTVDCAGLSQPLPPEEESGIVEVTEFYNTDLDHYFITASEAEANGIDQGAAGSGWIRTGESFLAWGVGSNVEAANVCRFYGSVNPGPNSHFYSVSTQECSYLMTLQEIQPADKPRWNLEGYAFSLVPPSQDKQQPCPDTFIPVYRAYNNGYKRGEDSNHRYVTNLDLLSPLLDKGWSEEGVVFCSPEE